MFPTQQEHSRQLVSQQLKNCSGLSFFLSPFLSLRWRKVEATKYSSREPGYLPSPPQWMRAGRQAKISPLPWQAGRLAREAVRGCTLPPLQPRLAGWGGWLGWLNRTHPPPFYHVRAGLVDLEWLSKGTIGSLNRFISLKDNTTHSQSFCTKMLRTRKFKKRRGTNIEAA
jgi:hypothetical protein